MFRRIMSEIDVKLGLKTILERVESAYAQRPQTIKAPKPLLVAVSKTKPAEQILECYTIGQRHFGENYVQELIEKGSDPSVLENCSEIKWHFIGRVQTNKINKIIKTPGIYMIETVDSEKLATNLDSAWNKLSKPDDEKLRVLVQINTSSEGAKSGVEPADCVKLYRHILENCKNLKLEGIMTIGKFGHDYSTGPNPDFICLMKCHEDVCNTFGLGPDDVHVSMGMSDDFEKAIEMGSTIVRVGSSIFGFRPKKNEEKSEEKP